MEKAPITNGELAVLRVCAARHLIGEAFDPVRECGRGHWPTAQVLGKLPSRAILGFSDALSRRGYLARLGGGAYSLTQEGEERYSAAYNAKMARVGAGTATKAKRG